MNIIWHHHIHKKRKTCWLFLQQESPLNRLFINMLFTNSLFHHNQKCSLHKAIFQRKSLCQHISYMFSKIVQDLLGIPGWNLTICFTYKLGGLLCFVLCPQFFWIWKLACCLLLISNPQLPGCFSFCRVCPFYPLFSVKDS